MRVPSPAASTTARHVRSVIRPRSSFQTRVIARGIARKSRPTIGASAQGQLPGSGSGRFLLGFRQMIRGDHQTSRFRSAPRRPAGGAGRRRLQCRCSISVSGAEPRQPACSLVALATRTETGREPSRRRLCARGTGDTSASASAAGRRATRDVEDARRDDRNDSQSDRRSRPPARPHDRARAQLRGRHRLDRQARQCRQAAGRAEPCRNAPPPGDAAPVASIRRANAPTASASAGRAPAAVHRRQPAAARPRRSGSTGTAEPVSTRSEFGVDIGGGPTLAALRDGVGSHQAQSWGLLDGLRPVIAVRDNRARTGRVAAGGRTDRQCRDRRAGSARRSPRRIVLPADHVRGPASRLALAAVPARLSAAPPPGIVPA